MKTYLHFSFICFIIFSFSIANAQDWKPFDVGRIYQYKNKNATRYYTLQVDASQVVAGKTIYDLDKKRIMDNGHYSGGYFGSQVFISALGDSAQFVREKYPFNQTSSKDTLLIKLNAKEGDTWPFSSSESTTIRLAKKEVKEIFAGDLDSVQVFVTSQSDSIWLSKKYGLVGASYFDKNWGNDYLVLDAIKELNKGLFRPDLRRMYDFEVGDIFIREYTLSTQNRTCPSSHSYNIDTITGKRTNLLQDTVWYSFNQKGMIVVTALTVETRGQKKQITELTSKTGRFSRLLETEIYGDSLITLTAGMEDAVEERYAVGLGNTLHYVNTIFGVCSYEVVKHKLICWKTSKSESPHFKQCLATILSIDEEKDFSAAKVYPNPAQNLLSIELPQMTREVQLHVYDQLGNKCLDQKISTVQSTVDVSSLANGIYYLSLRTGQKNFQRTFIKQ